MTNQEAIKKAEQELSTSVYLGAISRSPGMKEVHEHRAEWLTSVIALAKKQLAFEQASINPLTIAELRNIHGEPVYIKPYGWRVCYGIEPADIHDGIEKINLGNNCYLPLNGYGDRWIPYRQKPEDAE